MGVVRKPLPAECPLPLHVEAVVFDLDGTLLDTETTYREAFMTAAASLELSIAPGVYDSLVGIATCERGAILRRRYGQDFPWDSLRESYYALRGEAMRGGVRVKPGVSDLLRHVEGLKLAKAVATSASRQTAEKHLNETGLWERFDHVVTRDDVERGKPYPDVFVAAAQGVGVPPRRCLALEDSEPGIMAAWLAGMLPMMVADTLAATDAIRARSIGAVRDLDQVRALLGG